MATTRKPKFVKTPIAEAVETAEVKHEQTNDQSTWTQFMDDLKQQFPDDSWKRKTVAYVATLVVAIGIGYAVGTALGYMLVGATVLGAPVFMQFVMYFLGIILSFYISRKVSPIVYEAIMDKTIERYASDAYAKVTGWFSSKPQGATA